MRIQRQPLTVVDANVSWSLADDIAERYEAILAKRAAKRAERRKVTLRTFSFQA